MITLYRAGTAAVVDGVSVDYVIVNDGDVEPLKEVGWCEKVVDIENAS